MATGKLISTLSSTARLASNNISWSMLTTTTKLQHLHHMHALTQTKAQSKQYHSIPGATNVSHYLTIHQLQQQHIPSLKNSKKRSGQEPDRPNEESNNGKLGNGLSMASWQVSNR
jgi:hypothetical protein